jgi:hypothetical protein
LCSGLNVLVSFVLDAFISEMEEEAEKAHANHANGDASLPAGASMLHRPSQAGVLAIVDSSVAGNIGQQGVDVDCVGSLCASTFSNALLPICLWPP